ncbi:MAG: chorismate mutase [Acidobacteria bacterium]|nr:chorismate mutase [Acidobacteriota bacterium]
MDISDWRKRIDEVDAKLVDLLSDRSGCVMEIGRIKGRRQLAVRDPEREERILERIARNNKGPLADEAVARIFEAIIHECIRLEEQLNE